MTILNLTDLDVAAKRVLMREDLNVPLADGEITSDMRIRAALPGIQLARDKGASVLVMSHLGRPKEGEPDAASSLAPVAERLSTLLGTPVRLVDDYLNTPPTVAAGEVVLLENVRYNVGEKADDEDLSRRYAALCDVFVMDAFGTAHRAQASTHGVGLQAPVACAGPLLAAELDALGKAFDKPKQPFVAIVGGSKVSTKLTVLNSLVDKVDQLIVGGGIANTVIAAKGTSVGHSLYEPDLIDQTVQLMATAAERGASIPVPVDVVCGKKFSKDTPATVKSLDAVSDDDMIFDIGPETASEYRKILQNAGTIVWNGPVGVFEFDQFAAGTRELAAAIADSDAFSVAGGGDTLAAIDAFGIADKISYMSTGGGAFLEFLEGKTLPAVAMLEARGS